MDWTSAQIFTQFKISTYCLESHADQILQSGTWHVPSVQRSDTNFREMLKSQQYTFYNIPPNTTTNQVA
jgi:hypothetical protein